MKQMHKQYIMSHSYNYNRQQIYSHASENRNENSSTWMSYFTAGHREYISNDGSKEYKAKKLFEHH